MITDLLLSVVIPTYNRADAIEMTLRHLENQSISSRLFEVLVVDDGSTDETPQIIINNSFDLQLSYHQQSNRGAAAARNQGVKMAKGDLILFLDADVIPDRQLLSSHLTTHNYKKEYLVVGRVCPWPKTLQAWYQRVVYSDHGEMDYGIEERIIPFYMTLGGNFSLSMHAFSSIGGYDEAFPAGGAEETEFAFRATSLGYRIRYQPLAVGYHNHPRTLKQICRQQESHTRWMALLITKHPELKSEIPGVDDLMPLWTLPATLRIRGRRLRTSFYGLAPIRFSFYVLLSFLNYIGRFPRVTSIAYWRLIRGWRHVGFRHGLRCYGYRHQG